MLVSIEDRYTKPLGKFCELAKNEKQKSNAKPVTFIIQKYKKIKGLLNFANLWKNYHSQPLLFYFLQYR